MKDVRSTTAGPCPPLSKLSPEIVETVMPSLPGDPAVAPPRSLLAGMCRGTSRLKKWEEKRIKVVE